MGLLKAIEIGMGSTGDRVSAKLGVLEDDFGAEDSNEMMYNTIYKRMYSYKRLWSGFYSRRRKSN